MLKGYNPKRPTQLQWSEETLQIFQRIKHEINECQLLYFMHPNAPVFLHTDASDYGIGAYLFQVIDAKEYPIMFMSKLLSDTELKWHTIDKERITRQGVFARGGKAGGG